MSRGLCGSTTVLLKIKMKDKMKVALAFLPKLWLKKVLVCFVSKLPLFSFFVFFIYFIYISFLFIFVFIFIFAAFPKRIICEFACPK